MPAKQSLNLFEERLMRRKDTYDLPMARKDKPFTIDV